MPRLEPGIAGLRRPRPPDPGPLEFRFLVAIDVEGFSRLSGAEQAHVQDDLESAMTRAAASAGLARERWDRQPRGDGELAVLPQRADGLSLVADYPRRLASALAGINLTDNGRRRLRVRLAIHHGAVIPGRLGPFWRAPVTVSRLVDAEIVRQQLRQRPEVDVALIVSATVFDEIIQSRLHDLNPEAFRRVIVRMKGTSYVGHLYQGIFMTPDREFSAPAGQPITA